MMDEKDRIHAAYLKACERMDQKEIAAILGMSEPTLRGFKASKILGEKKLSALEKWLQENGYFDIQDIPKNISPREVLFNMLARKLELLASVMKDDRIPEAVRMTEFYEAIRSLPEISKKCGL